MVLLRRLTLVASIVFCGSMALAAAGFAAGSNQSTFESSFSSISASATVGTQKGPQSPTGFFVFVSRSTQSFEQGSAGASGKSTATTQVFLTLFSPTSTTAGCFEIPASDFKISRDLQSASLNTKLDTSSKPCAGKGIPASGAPGVKSAAPLGGTAPPPPPPPPPGPLPLPITLAVTWTGNGIVSTSNNSSSFECLNYSTKFTDSVRSSIASASGTNSAADPAAFVTTQANLTADQSRQEVTGTPPQGCFQVFPG